MEPYTPPEYFNDVSMAEDKAAVLNRVRRIEGQVRGVAQMLEQDRYCIDILHHHLATREQTDVFKEKHGVETTPQAFVGGK